MIYATFTKRAKDMLPSLNEAHRAELLAFAAAAANTDQTKTEDGKVSQDEVLIGNFFPEICRVTACSAISAFGPMVPNNGNIVGRVLDWDKVGNGALNHLNAITIRKREGISTISVGYLGYFPVLTGVNSKGIFMALFDSPHGEPLQTEDRRSFTFDLRKTLESAASIQDATAILVHPELVYPFPFNSIVSDAHQTIAIENASPAGKHGADVRYATSALHSNIQWEFEHALGMVNSNLLQGHLDNHTAKPRNTERWAAIRKNLAQTSKDGVVDLADMRQMITHHADPDQIGSESENLYSSVTQHMTLWDVAAKRFQVWFRMPGETAPPLHPVFEDVALPWALRQEN